MLHTFFEMIIFNSDLDNTIIFSYKHEIGNQKKCVEIYQEREISYITEKTYKLLCEVNRKVLFVPTTTRTIEQYRRIDLGIGVPKYALVCNGGILLIDGKSDEEWYQDSLHLVSDSQRMLREGMKLLENDTNINFEIRLINDLFVFTKSSNPEATVEYLRENFNENEVNIFYNGVKIYIVPNVLTKGNAVKRLRERLKAELVIAAGDSLFDISMLECADYSISPQELSFEKKKNNYTFSQETIFSENVLNTVLQIERNLNHSI